MKSLDGLWPEFTERYEAAAASLATYRQKFEVFLKWARGRGAGGTAGAPQGGAAAAAPPAIVCMEDVTREVAEDYARFVFARKTTARKDIETLRRIWETLLPDQERNPWRIGLHLRAPVPKRPCNYRPLSPDEARRFVEAARRAEGRCGGGAPSASAPAPDGRYTTGADKFADLADAAVFAWHYGMRMGSLAALDWRDLATWRRGWFQHVPPKTRHTKPWPLVLPVVEEAQAVLEARAQQGQGQKRDGRGGSCASARDMRSATPRRGVPAPRPLFPALAAEYRRSQPNLAVSVKCLFREAGIADTIAGRAQMHSFRASFITQMDEAGAPSGITNAVTGHAPRTVHDMYSHPRPAALRRWLDRAIPDLGV